MLCGCGITAVGAGDAMDSCQNWIAYFSIKLTGKWLFVGNTINFSHIHLKKIFSSAHQHPEDPLQAPLRVAQC